MKRWGMPTPISPDTLKELYNYACWARDRQLQACASLTQEQLLRPLGGSFTCLRDTIMHLLGVEWLWLERWRGNSPRALPSSEELPTLDAIRERWKEVERNMRAYLSELDEDALVKVVTYTGTRGNTWTYQQWRMIMHLLNHQSYHRGQVTSLLRQLGEKPPAVDFLAGLDAGFRS